MVAEGGTGGTTAAPVTRKIWDGLLGLEGHKALLPGGIRVSEEEENTGLDLTQHAETAYNSL